jgi:uncharacterized protein DUF3567
MKRREENFRCGGVILITFAAQPKAVKRVIRYMNIVYNSENYYVVEYPVEHGFEVVDKQAARGTYFAGDVAVKFRESMIGTLGEDPSPEHVDAFLSDFGVLVNFPLTVH